MRGSPAEDTCIAFLEKIEYKLDQFFSGIPGECLDVVVSAEGARSRRWRPLAEAERMMRGPAPTRRLHRRPKSALRDAEAYAEATGLMRQTCSAIPPRERAHAADRAAS